MDGGGRHAARVPVRTHSVPRTAHTIAPFALLGSRPCSPFPSVPIIEVHFWRKRNRSAARLLGDLEAHHARDTRRFGRTAGHDRPDLRRTRRVRRRRGPRTHPDHALRLQRAAVDRSRRWPGVPAPEAGRRVQGNRHGHLRGLRHRHHPAGAVLGHRHGRLGRQTRGRVRRDVLVRRSERQHRSHDHRRPVAGASEPGAPPAGRAGRRRRQCRRLRPEADRDGHGAHRRFGRRGLVPVPPAHPSDET